MKRTAFAVMLLMVLLLAGCIGGDRAALATAADSYATTLNVLSEYKEAGLLSPEQVMAIEQARQMARLALDEWRASLDAGESPSQARQRFQAAIDKMILEQLATQQRRAGK